MDTETRPQEVIGQRQRQRQRQRSRTTSQNPERTSRLARYGLVLILIALLVGFSLARPSSFATMNNYRAIFNNQAVVALVALSAMMPLTIGELDLSVASILGAAQALVTGLCALQGLSPAMAVSLAVLAGAMLGLVNGVVIVKFKINAFVTTLASGTVVGGLVIWYTGGAPIYQGVPKSLTRLARGYAFGIPLPIVYVVLVTAVLWFVLSRLPVGRRLYAVGGNRSAAQLSGIPADRILIATFVASGLLAAISGVVLGSQLGSVVPGGESTYLLPAFAGAFLGATAIEPGRFNPIGTVLAAYALSVAVSGLQQLGAPSWVQPVFNGAILIIAVGLSGHAARVKAARARAHQLARIDSETPEAAPPLSPAGPSD